MASSAVLEASSEGDNTRGDSSVDGEAASCELMLEALQEHLRSIEERLVELASDLLPSLTPPPGYSRSDAATGSLLNSREEERRRMEEDEQREAKQKEQARILEQKMHHLEVLASRERQYAVNRRRYNKLMSLHIEQQKLELNKRQEKFERRREKQQAKERKEMLKKKPVRYKTTGEADYSFLAHLPQTLFYKIVAMETELKKAGKLNGTHEVKEFWDAMLAPPPAAAPAPAPAVKGQKSSRKYSSLMVEDIYSEEDLQVGDSDDVTNSWAITATDPDPNIKFLKSRRRIYELTRFVPTEVPVLKPLSEIFDSDGASQKEEEEQLKKHKARIEFLQTQNRTVNEMYQTARANEITMRRMLEESGLLQEEPTKLFPDLQTMTQTKSHTAKSSSSPHSKTNNKIPTRKAAFVKGSKLTSTTASSSTSSYQTQVNRKISSEANERPNNRPVPLHIGAVEKDVPIKEARHTSLWKNYAKTLTAK